MTAQHGTPPALVVANPVPVVFWKRDMLWRDAEWHGYGTYAVGQGATLEPGVLPNRLDDSTLAARRDDPAVRAFLFWARMPVVTGYGEATVLTDQRFTRSGVTVLRGSGSANPFIVPLATPK